MPTLRIPTAQVFRPLLGPARYKGTFGGRGCGKSHFFGSLVVEECLSELGTLVVCIREKQMTLAQSSKRLIEAKIEAFGVGSEFRIYDEKIKTPGDGLIIFQGMQDHTAESIKSLEGFRIAWIDEAQALSQRSLALLRPTIRAAGSEIWASWNPRRKTDAIDEFLRQRKPDNAVIVRSSWRDNPWFTPELEEERQLDLKLYPERYHHIWEGEYAKAFEGAYFAKQLAQAKAEGRIGHVGADPVLPYKAFFDLGGTAARADALAIWIVQFVGREIRVLDYIEGMGQEIGYYIAELRKPKYDQALLVLPHDGDAHHGPINKTYKTHFQDAGFEVDVIPNQGAGAATLRIEAARRIFPACWFNQATTEAGREALGFYHERKDEHRNIGMGPEHDWSSHGADAFGLMAICYEQPPVNRRSKSRTDSRPSGATHWSA
jgi:phage terminase large subunit